MFFYQSLLHNTSLIIQKILDFVLVSKFHNKKTQKLDF